MSDYYENALDDTIKGQMGLHLLSCLVCVGVYHDLEMIVETSSVLKSEEFIVFPDENALWRRINQATH